MRLEQVGLHMLSERNCHRI